MEVGERSQSLAVGTAWLDRAQAVDASFQGRAGVLSAGYGPGDAYPVFVRRASGAHVEDVDGNRYLDFLQGFGSVVLGHADPQVSAAVTAALAEGVAPSLHLESQVTLAERLVRTVPGAEMAAFLKTGSDATSLAVRLCRAYRKRDLVLRWGYHGWHDWCAPRPGGIPAEVRARTAAFSYNDAEGLVARLQRDGEAVACVIMMPVEIDPPEPGFLEAVRAACDHHGIPLVFDEVRTGFRLAPGGAQSHFGIAADLVCLSKAMANGHAISAVAGRREIMRCMADVSASSVFFRGADGFAAAHATLDRLEGGAPYRRLWSLGQALSDGLAQAAVEAHVPARPAGLAVMPFLRFDHGDPALDQTAMRTFCKAMLKRGVLLHPAHHWFTCLAMTEADIAGAVAAAREAFAEVASACVA